MRKCKTKIHRKSVNYWLRRISSSSSCMSGSSVRFCCQLRILVRMRLPARLSPYLHKIANPNPAPNAELEMASTLIQDPPPKPTYPVTRDVQKTILNTKFTMAAVALVFFNFGIETYRVGNLIGTPFYYHI